MGKKEKTFKEEMDEIKTFLKTKKLLPELALRSNVTVRTVYNTLGSNSFDELKGDRLIVYNNALLLIEEINSLPSKAKYLVNMISDETINS